MPELPEVETTMRGLKPHMQNQMIAYVILHRHNLRLPFPPGFVQQLSGSKIRDLTRIAKYIVITLEPQLKWLIHLGMSGNFSIITLPTPLKKHDHVQIFLANGIEIRYHDPRRFGSMQLMDETTFQQQKWGIDPFSPHLTTNFLYQHLAARKINIKAALMDQNLISGIGNIYASESLYESGIHPLRPANSLSKKECTKLISAIQSVLDKAIRMGGSSLKDFKQADGTLGYFQNEWAVYNKAGQACPHCQNNCPGITLIKISGRSTYFCSFQQQ